MYFDGPQPWMEFPHIEHGDEVVIVNPCAIVGIAKAASGVNLHFIGGSVIAVKGKAAEIRTQVDKFLLEWPDRRRAITRKMDEELERRERAEAEAKGQT